jgi:type IV fimbrial biogenesis protein FimT
MMKVLRRGFTLIELLVVVVISAILLTVAVPGFGKMLSKRRVEGVTSELVTDLQYARSEAVARNQNVSVSLGAGCYTIHLSSATAVSCTSAAGSSVTPAGALVKGVQLPASSVSLTALGSVTRISFEPMLGSASFDAAVNPGVLSVNGAGSGSWQLQVRVASQGRVKTCSPSGSGYVSGFSSECGDS